MSSKELLPKVSAGVTVAGWPNAVPLDFRNGTGCLNDPESLTLCSNTVLREAIRSNAVTFPSQVVWFGGCGNGEVGRRVVQLYFVSGWPVARICDRYLLSKTEVHRILREWRHRAVAVGFLQEIQSDSQERVPSSSSTYFAVCVSGSHCVRNCSSGVGKIRVFEALDSAIEDQCEELGLDISAFRFSRIEEALRLILGPTLSSDVLADMSKRSREGSTPYSGESNPALRGCTTESSRSKRRNRRSTQGRKPLETSTMDAPGLSAR